MNLYWQLFPFFLTEECPCDNFSYRYDNSINNGEYRWKKLFVLSLMEKLYA